MAKSMRSKVKRSFRAKKREEGVYAASEAARLQRLNAKLVALTEEEAPKQEEGSEDGDDIAEDIPAEQPETTTDTMDVDGTAPSSATKVSTHGPRESRREQWRASKGMAPRPKARGMNRQGFVAARRKSGKSQRRR